MDNYLMDRDTDIITEINFAHVLTYSELGQYQQVINLEEQHLVIALELDDRAREGRALKNLGKAYFRLSQYSQALEYLEQALMITREVGDHTGEGETLGNLGYVYLGLGQYQQAIDLHEQVLAISREISDRKMESAALSGLGSIHSSLGQQQQAIDFYEQSLAIAREIGDRRGEGTALGNLGAAYDGLAEYQKAIDFYEQHLTIAREIGDRAGEGRSLGNLGSTYGTLGQYQQAITLHGQHIAIARDIGNVSEVVIALGNLGIVYEDLGQYQQAIDFYQQSLALAREIGDRKGEGITLGNLGSVHMDLGQYQQAIDFHEKSLVVAHEIGYRTGESIALGNLGSVYLAQGEYQQAISLLDQALATTREFGVRAEESEVLNSLGLAYTYLREYQQAINFYEQSMAILDELDNPSSKNHTLGNLGVLHLVIGQYKKAIEFFEQSLEISQETGDLQVEATSLSNLGASFIDIQQFSLAENVLYQSMNVYESLRTNLTDDQLISLIDTQQLVYVNLNRTLVAQGKNNNALTISERGRAQAFALQVTRRLRQSESDTIASSEAVTINLLPLEQIQQIAHDTNTTLVEYALIGNDFLYIWVVKPSGDIEFRSVELNGDGNAIALSTLDGPLYRGTPEPSEVDTLVTDSRSILIEPTDSTVNPTKKLQELHQLLIDPIADLLPTDPNEQVAFIPQGSLFHVPFAALQDDNGKYLIEKHTILTAPSIQVLGLAHDTAQTQSSQSLTANPVIVGNPTMPEVTVSTPNGFVTNRLTSLSGAETEAIQIASVLNTTALTDDQATEATIKAQLPTASLIHLATHGLLDYGESPLDIPGAIALAPTATEDGLLTSGEIIDMELQADLAVLSACDTGLGNITGDGVVGLSRSFITAGVPSVMVSLWAVNDDSTSLLMQRFYQFLETGKFTKAEALRQAQLSLLYDEDLETRMDAVRAGAPPKPREGFDLLGTRDPYHWAPFVLIGNGL